MQNIFQCQEAQLFAAKTTISNPSAKKNTCIFAVAVRTNQDIQLFRHRRSPLNLNIICPGHSPLGLQTVKKTGLLKQ